MACHIENNTDNVKEEIFKHCGKVYEILSDPSVSENDKYIDFQSHFLIVLIKHFQLWIQ